MNGATFGIQYYVWNLLGIVRLQRQKIIDCQNGAFNRDSDIATSDIGVLSYIIDGSLFSERDKKY